MLKFRKTNYKMLFHMVDLIARMVSNIGHHDQGQGHYRHFVSFLNLPKKNKLLAPITKLSHMVRKVKLKYAAVCENVLKEFNVAHCGIKVKITKVLAKFNHLIFQITSRDCDKVIAIH